MPWISKLSVLLTLLVFSVQSFAQSYIFSADSNRARVQAQLLDSRGELHSVTVNLTVPRMEVNRTEDGYDLLSVPGLVPLDVAGNPDLFTTGRLIAVPDGFEPELTVERNETREIADILPRPAQRHFRCDSSDESFAFNASLYASDATYPAQAVVLEEAGHLAGIRLVRIAIYPVQVNLKDHSVRVTTDLSARVDFRRTSEGTAPVKMGHLMSELIHKVPANGQDFGPQFIRTEASELLLIVTADEYVAAIQPYVAWKRQKGMAVEVVTYKQAGASKEKVKAYIKTYYASHAVKPSFLLFVGNKNTLPPYKESTANGSAATDYTFALLNGDSNIPNVAYGRLAVDSVQEATDQIDRWIAYEKNPIVGASWYHDGTTIASAEGSNPSDKEYAQQIQGFLKAGTFKTVDGFYNSEDTATYANIAGALKSGRSWLTYFGHGSGTSWGSTNNTFDVGSVGTLENNHKLPVVIDVACQNASWVKLARCFGKAWVTQKKGNDPTGAVAFYGGSVNVSWHPPAIMAVGVAKYHFEKAIASLGGSVLAGQLYLIEQKGNTSEVMDNVKWYNLLGDPTLSMRTDTPKSYVVKETVRKLPDGMMISLEALDAQGKAVKGLLASVHSKSVAPLAIAKTDANGKALISIPSLSEFEVGTLLTTTGVNLETRQIALR